MSDFSVSVVIPLFNKAPYIRRTLESALAQTLRPAEIIIVDDGSTDGGPEAIADLIGGLVRLIRQPNAGPGPARNRGAVEASSDWVALLDGDDLWLPAHLITLAELSWAVPSADILVNDHFDLIHGAIETPIEEENYCLRSSDFFDSRGSVHTSSLAIRRSVFAENQGFRSFCPGEDTEFWFRLALNHEYARSHRKTAVYFRNTNGLMDNYDKSSATYELPELFSSMNQAAEDPRYKRLHSKIVKYRDFVLKRSLKMALYQGDRRAAQRFAVLMSPEALAEVWLLRMLSWLPGTLVRGIAVSRTRILSLIRSAK